MSLVLKLVGRVCVGITMGLFAPSTATADPFCAGVAGLVSGPKSPQQGFALPEFSGAQAGCRTSLNTSGATSVHCMWVFPYRAKEAVQAFDDLLMQMAACGTKQAQKDQDVNHPDFYDLRLFSFSNKEVGVSLKDKGALQQTLVFLTVSQR